MATPTCVLITGMSGTGKSSVIARLGALGHCAIDADTPAWSAWTPVPASPDLYGPTVRPGWDWRWREDGIGRLLDDNRGEPLFLGGCAENMVRFYPRFDLIVLLSAPKPTIATRLRTRTTNTYGRQPEEERRILGLIDVVEPLLRRSAHHEIDTGRQPLAGVVAEILHLAGCTPLHPWQA